jgi:hypothetical protein
MLTKEQTKEKYPVGSMVKIHYRRRVDYGPTFVIPATKSGRRTMTNRYVDEQSYGIIVGYQKYANKIEIVVHDITGKARYHNHWSLEVVGKAIKK